MLMTNIFFFSLANRIRHFMQIVSLGDKLHELSNPIFRIKKNSKCHLLTSCTNLEIIWQLSSSCITRIHCNKYCTSWIQGDFCSFKHKCFKLLSNGSLYCLYLLGYHWQHLKSESITFILSEALLNEYCMFVLRFYCPVNPLGSWQAWSVYLTTLLLDRLSPLRG